MSYIVIENMNKDEDDASRALFMDKRKVDNDEEEKNNVA